MAAAMERTGASIIPRPKNSYPKDPPDHYLDGAPLRLPDRGPEFAEDDAIS
jgi:hypothetical protein